MRFLKLFEEWVIALKRNMFLRARLTLTLFYMVVIALIMGIFSVLLYYSLISNLSDSLQDKFENKAKENRVYADTTDQLQSSIIWGDSIGIIIVTFFSYFLAGKTLKPIRRALDDQKHFSSDASHELRTPLSVIQSESEILLRSKNPTPGEYRQIVQSTLEEVAKMKKITEQLLLVARSEEGVRKDFRKINLSDTVNRMIKNLDLVADAKEIKIHCHINGNVFILGIPDLVEHAISNILQNSIDYTPPRGEVNIKLEEKKGEAELKIKDTGIGIPEKDISNIFKRF